MSDSSGSSSSTTSRESPVTVDSFDADVDMSFRASQSFSRSQRSHGHSGGSSGRGGAPLVPPSTLSERLTMMNIPTQDLRGTVYYGWLWKKGSSFKTWKKRFFLLHGRALTYYTQCCVIASDSLGTQCLDMPAKGGLRVARAELTNETSFGLKVTSSSGRVLQIQAGDDAARMQWLDALEDAPKKRLMESMMRGTMMSEFASSRSNAPMNFTDTTSSTTSSLDAASLQSSLSTMSSSSDGDDDGDMRAGDTRGWLHVRTGVLHSWKKRFVTLGVDGHLTLATHRRSKRPQDKAYAVIACTPFSGHAHAFCVRVDRHKEFFMAAATEKEAEAWIEAFKTCL